MAKKVVKNSPKNIKQMTAIGVMVVVAAILVSAFYVSAKLITMEVPTSPSQSEARGKCPKGEDCPKPESKAINAPLSGGKKSGIIPQTSNKVGVQVEKTKGSGIVKPGTKQMIAK